jgi:glycosyltransferase involved in cell wall biosynthesis
MPVYNEARFVEDSLLSIVGQDYPNIEIILSDNGSTDETHAICQRLLSHRSDATINRFDTNMGATENFRFVLERARGVYFMWASGHDLWATDYVSRTVAVLEAEPGAVIAFGTSAWIDELGQPIQRHYGYTDTRGLPALSRFFTIYFGNMNPILGVIRKSSLDRARPLVPIVGADLILLTQLALQGDFVHSPETCWQRREFRHETSHSQKLRRYRSSDYALTRNPLDRMFPLLRLPLILLKTIFRSDLGLLEKTAAACALVSSVPVRYLAGKR